MTDIDKLVADKLADGKITDGDADAVLTFRDFLQIAGPPADKGGHPIRNLRWAGREDLIEWALGDSYVAPVEKVIEFDIPGELLSLNKLPNSAGANKVQRALKNEWKEAAQWAAISAFPGVGPSQRFLPPSDLYFSFPVTTNRYRDPGNFTRTTKPIVDAFVAAELWPGDDPRWVTEMPVAFRVVPAGELWKSKVIVRIVPRSTT